MTGCGNLTGRVERRPHGPMFLLSNAILRKGRIYIFTERTVPAEFVFEFQVLHALSESPLRLCVLRRSVADF